MKKATALIIAIAIVLTLIPAFSVQARDDRPVFQVIYDTLVEAGPKGNADHRVEIFKEAKSDLDTLDDSAARAKTQNLLNNREELARRRGIAER